MQNGLLSYIAATNMELAHAGKLYTIIISYSNYNMTRFHSILLMYAYAASGMVQNRSRFLNTAVISKDVKDNRYKIEFKNAA